MTTSTDEKNILGRPIRGDVDKRHFKPVEQWGAERLLADLDAVFAADPRISAIHWYQYTPYYNDGDPCEFGAHLNDDALVAYDKVPTSWHYDEAYDEDGEPVEVKYSSHFQDYDYKFSDVTKRWERVKKTGELPPATAEINQLEENWKHYEAVVREHFGEHSRVIATRDGFNVEFYEHD